MHNFWLVARHEYRRIAGKRSFLALTLAVPLGIAILIAAGIWLEMRGESLQPVGFVDRSGLLDVARLKDLPEDQDRLAVRAFSEEQAALAALENGEVQAVFVFPPDYLATLSTDLYYLKQPPGGEAWQALDDFVRLNLTARYPPAVSSRLLQGPKITVYDISSGRRFSSAGVINIILPFAASFLFLFATLSAAGYMLQAVTDEKENRVMEIMLTSLTPGQLIGGKAAGLLAVALSQLAIYAGAIVVGLVIAAPYVAELRQASVPWAYLGVVVLFFIPSYALFSAVMVAVGSAVSEFQQGQQFAGLLNLVFMLPLFLLSVLFEDPASTVVVLLSLFPPTALMTLSLRWGLGSVPLWQLALSWVLLVTAAIFMIWLAARVFRLGMLSYGQPLRWKTILSALRGA
jgi:ABC-2 type transport system permease protein